MKYKKKNIIYLAGVLIFLLIIGGKTDVWQNSKNFISDYINYVNSNIEHQAELFERVIGGLCAGCVTFGALFITILHENKKDKIFWKRERQKAKEERLLAVRPFLNIDIKSVSVARAEKCDAERDIVLIGQGKRYQYAHILLSNHGYGKCKKILLEGKECSVNQLDVDDEQEIDIYFKGLEDGEIKKDFSIFFRYQDIYGNSYLQQFNCLLKSVSRELDIKIKDPLLKKGEE